MAVGAELWDLLSTATHAVHAPPRGRASPSRCQLAVPYMNPSYAWGAEAPTWRQPGRVRPVLVHFRGRVMNRVRAALVRYYGGLAGNVIEAAHPNTAARCNLNKCSAKAKAKFNFPSQAVHLEEMRRSIFCLVPVGDSPPSSRLYLAVAAGCLPVMISDSFEGAFAPSIPWAAFSVRVPETTITAGGGGRKSRLPPTFNLTAFLTTLAANRTWLEGRQQALQAHAADVLWEAPNSRVGHHALGLAALATKQVCHGHGGVQAPPQAGQPQPQVTWAAEEA